MVGSQIVSAFLATQSGNGNTAVTLFSHIVHQKKNIYFPERTKHFQYLSLKEITYLDAEKYDDSVLDNFRQGWGKMPDSLPWLFLMASFSKSQKVQLKI